MSALAHPEPPPPRASAVATGDLVFDSDRLGADNGVLTQRRVAAETAHIKATTLLAHIDEPQTTNRACTAAMP